MRNIYPLNSRFTLPFAFVLAVSLLVVSLMFILPGGPLHAQTPDDTIKYPENGTGAVVTFTAVDPEGESIVWSLADGDDMGDFSIENGVLRFKSPPDYEDINNTDHMYAVTVQASDGGEGTTAMQAVTIEVTNVEEPGTVTLSTLQPQVGVAITATLTDPDAITSSIPDGTVSDATWQWYRGNSEIVGATLASYAPTAGDVGSILRATAMYDDAESEDKTAQEDSTHAVRQAPESNIPPSFPDQDLDNGGVQTAQTREVAENTPAGTNLGAPIAASDPDVLTYSLSDTNGNDDDESFVINRATGQLMTKAALNYETKPSYTVTVTATDPFEASVTSDVTITVTDVNEAPTVAGDASIDHAESNEATVAALAADPTEYTASDPDTVADPVNDLKWSLSGADASKFQFADENLTGATRTLEFKTNPNFESPGDSGGNNVYEVTVKVTDSQGNSDEQDVTVKVTNIEETGMVILSTLQPRVGFPVTATLTDPDNITADSVSWQWYRGQTATSIQTANLSETECVDDTSNDCPIKGATSNTYTPVADDIDGFLIAVATYTDGYPAADDDDEDVVAGPDDEDNSAVLVDTRNKAPEFPDQDDEMEGRQTAQERMIMENTASGTDIGAEVKAEDEDGNLTYSLGGPDAGSFAIARNTGQLQVKAALDKEMKDTYTVTVTAADSLGASSTITVTIKVDNVDEMPDLAGEAPEEYAENGTAAVATFTATDPEGKSITWDLAGVDAADFSIVNGVLRFENSPDYEVPAGQAANNTYEITIEASDGGVNTTATKEVSIDVTNVEEPGTITLSTLQPQVGRPLTATLTDPDNAMANTVTWQWYRGSSPITDAIDGAGDPMSSYTPVPGDLGSTLRAQAMYDDGEGEDKTAREDSYRNVRSAPQSNIDPVFPITVGRSDTNQTREIAENTPAGRNLGARIAASDSGDVLTYSLDTGTDAAAFDISRMTGQLTTKAELDHETKETYTVTVTATDPFGAPATSVVTITVTDVNEPPTVMGVASIDHPENRTALDRDSDPNNNVQDAIYAVSDPEMDQLEDGGLKLSLRGNDRELFSISANGLLSFKDAPDFESPGDSGRDNVYQVTVEVSDSKSNTAELAVTVKVTNMEEAGLVELSTLQPRIGFPITATLTDADNITANSVSWQWYKGTVTKGGLDQLDMTECAAAVSNDCFIKGATSATYTPVAGDASDVNATLVAVALYTDGRPNAVADPKDFAMMATANQVLADTRNKAPVFKDQDDEMEGDQTDQERSVAENVPATELVRIIGDPVVATDFITANNGDTTTEILTYSLGGADAASFDIVRSSGQLQTKAALDKETKDTYTVTVTATDPSGETATVTVTIKVTNVDEMPTIMVGGLAISGKSPVEYAENGTGAVATYMVAGPDAALARWSLEGPDADAFTIRGGELNFNNSPDYDMPADADNNNTYMVIVKATDGTYTDSLDVTVTVVADADEVPTTISAGLSNTEYAENDTRVVETYMVAGTNAALATWSLDGTDAGDFTISSSGVLTFRSSPDYEMPADADTDNTYMVIVKATDGTYTDTLNVTVMVTDEDEVPTIAGDDTIDYVENDTGDVATYTAMDPEGAEISWTLDGPDAGDFTIIGGVLVFGSSPDYEMPADADTDNTYMVTVKAAAGADMGTHEVVIMVTDEDEVPTIAGDDTIDYAENGTGDVATYTAMDPEEATITWSLSGTDAGVFDISGAGVLTFNESPDYEMPADADNIYMVTVEASAGTNMASHEVTVTVTDVDEALTSISGPSNTDYAENRTDDVATFISMDPEEATITWSLSGTDAGVFDISGAGVLTFNESPDYEMSADADNNNIYMITVNASAGTDMDSLDVTVTVTDVDEALTSISGPSNTDYAENGTDDVATYTAMDPDGTAISWSLAGDDADVFDISSAGVLTFNESPDYEMSADADNNNIYMITVNASAGTDMDSLDVTVTVTDVDEALTSISGPSNTDYAENGTDDVATYTAMDPDGTAISWSLAGDDADVFDISSAGVLTFNESPDYETSADADNNNIYMITVNASAGTHMDSLDDVTVTVTDEDEVPTIAGDATIDYAENGTDDVATYTAMDPEEATITWSLAGDDAAAFDITDGVLTFNESPDYEMSADADADNTYMVTVEASDGTNMATTLAVTITVTDEEDTVVEQTLLDRYDANDNDQIDVDELREAITHYLHGDIDVDDVREIIRLYVIG